MLVFPSSYFSDQQVDEAMQAEYDAAKNTGLFSFVLFSYEKWFYGGRLKLNREPDAPVRAVYRGWMMQPTQYAAFYSALAERGIRLITSPEAYEQMHIFPNVYPKMQDDTPRMLVFPEGQHVSAAEIRAQFPRFMIKDYVKSVKETEFPRFFDSDITQETLDLRIAEFKELRGQLYMGGICIKEFVSLKRYGGHTNEYRVFYMDHMIGTVSRNGGQPDFAPQPPLALLEKYQSLGSPYYTMDYAETEAGEWKALEAGDGQVSGLSDNQDAEAYYRALYHALTK
jgi:hypothetical protein